MGRSEGILDLHGDHRTVSVKLFDILHALFIAPMVPMVVPQTFSRELVFMLRLLPGWEFKLQDFCKKNFP